MRLRLDGAALAVAALLVAVPGAAQQSAEPAYNSQPGSWDPATPLPAGWKVPRTAWGDPDLRGNWPIDYLAQTPRQRDPRLGTRAELNDAEYAAALKNARAQEDWYAKEEQVGKLGMGHWIERGEPLRQSSLITEPADGRIPAMTPAGAAAAARMKSSWTEQVFNWVDDFNTFDRCITRGMPSSMLPGNYNSGIELWQAPGYVAIRLEMIHETRIIPLDGRGAPAPAIKGWLGYSRGHWEGDALVIETTNFVPGTPISNVGSSPRPVPNSAAMTMTEKLTPVGPDELHYEAWISDPAMLTGPFKLDFPWRRNSAYVQYEYACHEGNVQLRGYIEGMSTNPRLVAEREAKARARAAGGD